MNEELADNDSNVHLRQFLTDNVLVPFVDTDGNTRYNINRTGQWALIIQCTITKDVQDRLDTKRDPASFTGHFVVESSLFFIQEYAVFGELIRARMIEEIKRLVKDKAYSDITQAPTNFKVDIEPILERKYTTTVGTPHAISS